MTPLTINIQPRPRSKKIRVEMDADKFERFAAALGFFSDDFLASLDSAEKDFELGRVKKIASLAELGNNRNL